MYVCMYVCMYLGRRKRYAADAGTFVCQRRDTSCPRILQRTTTYTHEHTNVYMYIHTNKHAGTDRSLELVLVQLSCHFMDVGSEQLVLLERYLVRAALALVFGPDEYVCMYACMYVYTFVYMNAYMD